jgi:hypothetical protein
MNLLHVGTGSGHDVRDALVLRTAPRALAMKSPRASRQNLARKCGVGPSLAPRDRAPCYLNFRASPSHPTHHQPEQRVSPHLPTAYLPDTHHAETSGPRERQPLSQGRRVQSPRHPLRDTRTESRGSAPPHTLAARCPIAPRGSLATNSGSPPARSRSQRTEDNPTVEARGC